MRSNATLIQAFIARAYSTSSLVSWDRMIPPASSMPRRLE